MRFALAWLLLMTTPQLAAADGRDYGEIPYAEKVACKTADDCVYVKGFCHSAAVNKRFKEQEREQMRPRAPKKNGCFRSAMRGKPMPRHA